MNKSKTLIVILILLSACTKNLINVEFIEIKNDTARFDIKNHSEKDLDRITVKIMYLNENNSVILTDTISYKMNKEDESNKPFLKAGEETFIIQKIPNNCILARIKILDMGFTK